jgi:hypothetical protein
MVFLWPYQWDVAEKVPASGKGALQPFNIPKALPVADRRIFHHYDPNDSAKSCSGTTCLYNKSKGNIKLLQPSTIPIGPRKRNLEPAPPNYYAPSCP